MLHFAAVAAAPVPVAGYGAGVHSRGGVARLPQGVVQAWSAAASPVAVTVFNGGVTSQIGNGADVGLAGNS